MDQQKIHKKVTAIVPAYNESERIGPVLDILTTYPHFQEIIVIDDGSTDDTKKVIERYPVTLIHNTVNQGKAFCMDVAVRQAKTDVIFFCDADIKGLKHSVIDDINEPVVNNKVSMFIGMRNRKIYILHTLVNFVPLLGGERALKKSLWIMLPDFYKKNFRIEAALNFYAKYYADGFDIKVFHGVSQTIKEKKYGFAKGFKHRIRMMTDITVAEAKLQFIHIPHSIKNIRAAVVNVIVGLLGIILGGFIVIGTHIGPRTFITHLFARELVEDGRAPFVNMLLYITGNVSTKILLIIGWVITTLNFIAMIFALYRLILSVSQSEFSFSKMFTKVKK